MKKEKEKNTPPKAYALKPMMRLAVVANNPNIWVSAIVKMSNGRVERVNAVFSSPEPITTLQDYVAMQGKVMTRINAVKKGWGRVVEMSITGWRRLE